MHTSSVRKICGLLFISLEVQSHMLLLSCAFPCIRTVIHPCSALPLSKCSHPIPKAVMCCQYFNNVTIAQLSPAPSSRCRVSVLWCSGNPSMQNLGSFCLSQGKKLMVLHYTATANLCLVEARQGWRKVVSINHRGCHSYLTLGVNGTGANNESLFIFFKLPEKIVRGRIISSSFFILSPPQEDYSYPCLYLAS